MPLHPLSFAAHELRGLCRDGVALLLQVDKLYGELNVAGKWRASGGKWWQVVRLVGGGSLGCNVQKVCSERVYHIIGLEPTFCIGFSWR